MVRRKSEWPEVEELVMCTISKVFPQGSFAKLDEYGGKEGMIHVSEVASGWVRNIRNYIREGQKVVCKVLTVDTSKGHIDLSIRRVKSSQRKWKVQQYKREQKADKLLERASKKLNKDIETAYAEVGYPLQEQFGDLYSAFEEVAAKGAGVLDGMNFEKEWVDSIVNLSKTYVEPPSVEIIGHIELSCPTSNGVEVIRSALIKARDSNQDPNINVDVRYIGSPKYSLKVTAPSYKIAEGVMKKVAESAIEEVSAAGGKGKFYSRKGE